MKYWYSIIIVLSIIFLINANHWFFFKRVIKKYKISMEGFDGYSLVLMLGFNALPEAGKIYIIDISDANFRIKLLNKDGKPVEITIPLSDLHNKSGFSPSAKEFQQSLHEYRAQINEITSNKDYTRFDKLSNKKKVVESEKAAFWITSNMTEIKKNIKKAGVDVPERPYAKQIGYGQVVQQRFNVIENMLLRNEEIVQQAYQILEVSKGYYCSRMKACLNPICWIEFLIYLPKELINISGIKITSVFLKIVQISYWIILIITAVVSGIQLQL